MIWQSTDSRDSLSYVSEQAQDQTLAMESMASPNVASSSFVNYSENRFVLEV